MTLSWILFFIFHFSSIFTNFFFMLLSRHLHMKDSSCPSKVERSKFSLKSNPYLKNKRKIVFFLIRNKTFLRCRSLTCSDFERHISTFQSSWLCGFLQYRPQIVSDIITCVVTYKFFLCFWTEQFLHFLPPFWIPNVTVDTVYLATQGAFLTLFNNCQKG